MKNLNAAIQSHMLDLERRSSRRFSAEATPNIDAGDRRKLQRAFGRAAVCRPGPGPPPAWRSKNEKTRQCFEMFLFMTGELRLYRMRNRPHIPKERNTHVPKDMWDKLFEFGQRAYPLADETIVREHLRERRRMLPYFDEPTTFFLMSYEHEGLGTAYAIIASPIG